MLCMREAEIAFPSQYYNAMSLVCAVFLWERRRRMLLQVYDFEGYLLSEAIFVGLLLLHTDVEALVGVQKFSRVETGMRVFFRPQRKLPLSFENIPRCRPKVGPQSTPGDPMRPNCFHFVPMGPSWGTQGPYLGPKLWNVFKTQCSWSSRVLKVTPIPVSTLENFRTPKRASTSV